MPLSSWFAHLVNLPRLAAFRDQPSGALLLAAQWDEVARCERFRVDRNGSVLAIVLVRLPWSDQHHRSLQNLVGFLGERLRLTDTVGWQRDGRLGVLLPDTPRRGAEVVAQEIAEFVGDQQGGLRFEISVYPADGGFDKTLDTPSETEAEAPPVGAPAAAGVQMAERLFAQPLPRWKRAVDVLGASLALLFFSPLMLFFAAAVASTSSGGALFRQEREGLGGRRFKILKFRTMISDAEQRKAELQPHSVQDGPAFKMYHDPRVTSIGRFLRATSLDELPQLINVLRGDMSLVGPRPLPVEESLACEPWQRQRLEVTPGITCIWQVNGRNTVSFEDWMRMDLRYRRNFSLWRDLRLLVSTIPAALLSRGPR